MEILIIRLIKETVKVTQNKQEQNGIMNFGVDAPYRVQFDFSCYSYRTNSLAGT
jgi:hypothetical protein